MLSAAVFLFAASVIGCSGGPTAPAGTAADIADKVFQQADVQPFGMSDEITKDNQEFYLGSLDYPEFADSAVVIPMISIDTRVLYIIKAANKGDVDAIKTALNENIDPERLICVTFSPDDVVIDSRGDVVFMTINSQADQRTALAEAFKVIE